MCCCLRLTCSLLVNLISRACAELADLICFTIMGQGLSVSEQLKVDMALQDTQNTSFEDEVIAQSNKEFNKVDRTIDKSELTIQSVINSKMNKQITEHNEPPAKPPISKKPQIPKPMPRQLYMNQPIIKPLVNDRPFDTLQKWNESLRNSVKRKKESVRRAMFERPLPVPVENEFYYMNVGRKEAEKLLEGHADGTFILRPSSQSSHAYTLTLTFSSRIYNIGVRRRPDARLALGFSKPSEQSFISITDLIEHYYTEKLVLLVDGRQVGCTQLRRINDRNMRED